MTDQESSPQIPSEDTAAREQPEQADNDGSSSPRSKHSSVSSQNVTNHPHPILLISQDAPNAQPQNQQPEQHQALSHEHYQHHGHQETSAPVAQQQNEADLVRQIVSEYVQPAPVQAHTNVIFQQEESNIQHNQPHHAPQGTQQSDKQHNVQEQLAETTHQISPSEEIHNDSQQQHPEPVTHHQPHQEQQEHYQQKQVHSHAQEHEPEIVIATTDNNYHVHQENNRQEQIQPVQSLQTQPEVEGVHVPQSRLSQEYGTLGVSGVIGGRPSQEHQVPSQVESPIQQVEKEVIITSQDWVPEVQNEQVPLQPEEDEGPVAEIPEAHHQSSHEQEQPIEKHHNNQAEQINHQMPEEQVAHPIQESQDNQVQQHVEEILHPSPQHQEHSEPVHDAHTWPPRDDQTTQLETQGVADEEKERLLQKTQEQVTQQPAHEKSSIADSSLVKAFEELRERMNQDRRQEKKEEQAKKEDEKDDNKEKEEIARPSVIGQRQKKAPGKGKEQNTTTSVDACKCSIM